MIKVDAIALSKLWGLPQSSFSGIYIQSRLVEEGVNLVWFDSPSSAEDVATVVWNDKQGFTTEEKPFLLDPGRVTINKLRDFRKSILKEGWIGGHLLISDSETELEDEPNEFRHAEAFMRRDLPNEEKLVVGESLEIPLMRHGLNWQALLKCPLSTERIEEDVLFSKRSLQRIRGVIGQNVDYLVTREVSMEEEAGDEGEIIETRPVERLNLVIISHDNPAIATLSPRKSLAQMELTEGRKPDIRGSDIKLARPDKLFELVRRYRIVCGIG